MSKAKFAAAKELIDEKNYAEARKLLKTIDHPTARAWEQKLNKIAPTKRKTSPVTWVLLIVSLIVLGVVFAYQRQQAIESQAAASEMLDRAFELMDVRFDYQQYCEEVRGGVESTCEAWAIQLVNEHEATARLCSQYSWITDAPSLGICLMSKQIELP